jgi:hypothetical protein
MIQLQPFLEVILFSLIIILGFATIYVIFRGRIQSIQSPKQLSFIPDNARDRGDYLLDLIREGHFSVKRHEN